MKITQYNREVAWSVTLGAAVAIGQLVGIDSAGLGVLADANTTPIPARGFAVSGGAIGARITLCQQGIVEGFASLTPGATQYTSPTAGGITETRPATAADIIQPVGHASSATRVVFNISDPFAVYQAAGNSLLG